MKKIYVLIYITCLFEFSCSQNKKTQEEQQQNKSDNLILVNQEVNLPNDSFNVEIRPDTTVFYPPIAQKKPKEEIINKRVVVQKHSDLFLLVGDNYYLPYLPVNLPVFINPGDTIIITGKVFGISIRETLQGIPVLLERIYAHSPYRNIWPK